MPKFDRSLPWAGTSLALVAFRKQFTETNDQYWGSLPTEILANRFLRSNSPAAKLEAALGTSGGNWHRVGHDVDSFATKFKLSRSWARLNTLMLVSSSIEMYFRNITRVAQLSDPTLTPGFPKSLEGLTLLKRGARVTIDSTPFLRGAWTQRLAAYERSFGSAPAVALQAIGDLEQMRRLRNRIAHEFGLEVGPGPYGYLSGASAVRISQQRLQKWLAIADQVVKAIDSHLVIDFVGDFETLELYHMWKQDKSSLLREAGIHLPSHSLGDNSGFLKYLARVTIGRGPGKIYWRGLDQYERLS